MSALYSSSFGCNRCDNLRLHGYIVPTANSKNISVNYLLGLRDVNTKITWQ